MTTTHMKIELPQLKPLTPAELAGFNDAAHKIDVIHRDMFHDVRKHPTRVSQPYRPAVLIADQLAEWATRMKNPHMADYFSNVASIHAMEGVSDIERLHRIEAAMNLYLNIVRPNKKSSRPRKKP